MAITFDPRIDGYMQVSRVYASSMAPVNNIDESFTAQEVHNDPYYHQIAIEDQIANGLVDLQEGDTLGNVVDGMQEILASDSIPLEVSDQQVISELIASNPDLYDYINDMGYNISTMTANQVNDLLNLDLNEANIVKLQVQQAMNNLRNPEILNIDISSPNVSGRANAINQQNQINPATTNLMNNHLIHPFDNPSQIQNPVSFGNSMPDNVLKTDHFSSVPLSQTFRGASPDPDEFSNNAMLDNSRNIHTFGPNNAPFANYLSEFDQTGFGQAIRNRLPSALHGIETQMHLGIEPQQVA